MAGLLSITDLMVLFSIHRTTAYSLIKEWKKKKIISASSKGKGIFTFAKD